MARIQATPEAWAFARRQARIHGYGVEPDSVSFAAGWLAGLAEGRRQAAEAIRAEAGRLKAMEFGMGGGLVGMSRDSAYANAARVAEQGRPFVAARLAEGKEESE